MCGGVTGKGFRWRLGVDGPMDSQLDSESIGPTMEPKLGWLFHVLRQDTLTLQCLSCPKSVNATGQFVKES